MEQVSPVFRGTRRFRLVAPLGAGGMGVVYEAVDQEDGCTIALKVLPNFRPAAVVAFKREFRSLQGIHHPNLVTLGDLIEHERHLFFTMELVRGVDILSYVRVRVPLDRPSSPSRGDLSFDEPTARRSDEAQRARPPERETATPHEPRLRAAFLQLARGLAALHGAAKVHRDVKPSNVLVTREGRAVLLDFGLVADLDRPSLLPDGAFGTVSYVSPEQAAGQPASPASDWYSFGAILFESFTGRPPFVGAPESVLEQKALGDGPSPSVLAKEVPADLDCLCSELLRCDPALRPSGSEVLARLAQGEVAGADDDARLLAATPFVGRVRELGALEDAFRRTDRRPLVVAIAGESGVGKTALMRELAATLRASGPAHSAVVLCSRCSERERIPFKAFDEIASQIAEICHDPRTLSDLLATTGFAVALRGAAGIFPVLAEVARGLVHSPTQQLDWVARRTAAFHGVREIVRLVAERSRVVFCIDDWQWADADSIALLSSILAGPSPPPVLVLLFQRENAPDTVRVEERLTLRNLEADEAETLAHELLTNERLAPDTITPSARSIASESTGHPFFVLELVQQVVTCGQGLPLGPRLDDALWARFCALEPTAKHAARVLASARAPIPFSVLSDAMAHLGSPVEWWARPALMHRLQSGHFARFVGLSGLDGVDCFHDRVATAILSRLPEQERQACHHALAVALENAATLDFESLTAHWLGAGQADRAARCAETAGDRAMQGLAFQRATELYGLSLKLGGTGSAPGDVRAKLGEALSHLGRGREAAQEYLAAAASAPAERRVVLQRLAADQLFRSGHFDEAVRLAEHVFAALGLALPRSRWSTWARLIGQRIRLRLRGDRFERRAESTVAPGALVRLDAGWSVAVGLGMLDNFRGSYVQSCHLHMALEVGEPFRVLRALAMEVSYRATAGSSARKGIERWVQGSEDLARELGDPYAFGFTHLTRGIGTFLCGDWEAAKRACQSAEAIFENRPALASWELASARLFLLFSQFFLGDLASLRKRVPELVQEAKERGDLFAAVNLRLSVCNAAWLVGDVPKEARRHLEESDDSCPRKGGHIQRYWSAIAWANLCLYEGFAEEAHRRVVSIWPMLRRSMLLRMEFVRVEFHWLRGRCALARAEVDSGSRATLLREAENCAWRLGRERADWAKAVAHFLYAGAHSLRGAERASIRALDEGVRAAEAIDFGLMTRAAAPHERSSDSHSLSQIVARPDRWRAMLLPALRVR